MLARSVATGSSSISPSSRRSGSECGVEQDDPNGEDQWAKMNQIMYSWA